MSSPYKAITSPQDSRESNISSNFPLNFPPNLRFIQVPGMNTFLKENQWKESEEDEMTNGNSLHDFNSL